MRKRYKLTDKQNPIFHLNSLQEQIILGGKLGDGNFKPNGKKNYYYRESHASDEYEYLLWKMNALGKDIIAKGGIYPIKKQGYNVQQPYGFSTKTSPTFIQYAEMSLLDTISLLDEKGLIIFMLDDGWFSKHTKAGNFCISGGILNYDELLKLCSQFEIFNIKDVHIVGKQRLEISIPSINNQKLFEMATSFIPRDIDIMIKKFPYERFKVSI